MKAGLAALFLVIAGLAGSTPALAQNPNAYEGMLGQRITAMTRGCQLPGGTIVTSQFAALPAAVRANFPGMIEPTASLAADQETLSDTMGFPTSKPQSRLVGAVSLGQRWAVVYDMQEDALTTNLMAFHLGKDGSATPVRGPDITFFTDACKAFQQALTPGQNIPLS